ncbi:hypothetical protein V6N13_090274 [Hibiscus sabdariffa]
MESNNGLPGNPNSNSTGIISGRLPDLVVDCDLPVTLERHGSLVAMSDQRASKKGRNQEVDAHEADVSMMEVGDTPNGIPRPTVDDLDVEEACGQSGQKGVEDRVRDGSELNKEDLYGPWIRVTNPLSQLHDHDIIGDDHNGTDVVTDQTRRVLGSTLARGKAITPPHAESSKTKESDDAVLQNGIPSPQKHGEVARQVHIHKEVAATFSRNTFPIASSEQVTMVDTSLSKGNHVAVQVGAPAARERSGRILSSSITGNGGNKGQGSAQSNIVQQASDLSDSLNGAVEAVQWRENTAFDLVETEEMQD